MCTTTVTLQLLERRQEAWNFSRGVHLSDLTYKLFRRGILAGENLNTTRLFKFTMYILLI